METIRQYDSFLESLKHIAIIGAGSGEDSEWWATLENYNNPPEPYNFNCLVVDPDGSKLSKIPSLKNIHKINEDISKEYLFPIDVDLIWAYDILQTATNPIETLYNWNKAMNTNGMLLLTVPQHNGVENDRYYSRSYNGCYYNFTPVNLIYMLAVNGFDCRDAYLLKKFNDPWIQMAVYKSDVAPMDPKTTSWFDLIDKNLLHPSIVSSLNSNGYLKQEEIVMPWLDKELYFVEWVSQKSTLPGMPEIPEIAGVFNETIESTEHVIQQPKDVVKETPVLKPIKIKNTAPVKKSYKNG